MGGQSQPFIFVQIATWPCHDNGMITGIRNAQQQVAELGDELPAVGMVVAADIGDPGGVNHPVYGASVFQQNFAFRGCHRIPHLLA
jgi:hypothetical protein